MAVSWAAGVLLVWPATIAWMRIARRWRIRDLRALRRRARDLAGSDDGPLVVCPNHLTWVDSMLVQYALASPWELATQPRSYVWNLAEQSNFFVSPPLRWFSWLSRCIPIARCGDRSQQKRVLAKAAWLLRRGDRMLVFPEGGRSPDGRICRERIADGVGRLVRDVGGARVLCVYLRGERQSEPSVLPAPHQTFAMDVELLRPSSGASGVRASREIAMQILDCLERMEAGYFADRQ
jgi:hypothetical protein